LGALKCLIVHNVVKSIFPLDGKIVLRSNDTIELGAFELARAPAAA
jgi:hypothetical protein